MAVDKAHFFCQLAGGWTFPRISSKTSSFTCFSFLYASFPAIIRIFHVTMNILEDQVTDLQYLAESPLAISAVSMNGHRQSSSAESPDVSGTKRKADDANSNNATHTRAKRNRYISIAW